MQRTISVSHCVCTAKGLRDITSKVVDHDQTNAPVEACRACTVAFVVPCVKELVFKGITDATYAYSPAATTSEKALPGSDVRHRSAPVEALSPVTVPAKMRPPPRRSDDQATIRCVCPVVAFVYETGRYGLPPNCRFIASPTLSQKPAVPNGGYGHGVLACHRTVPFAACKATRAPRSLYHTVLLEHHAAPSAAGTFIRTSTLVPSGVNSALLSHAVPSVVK